MRALFQFTLADFRERSRQYGFLVTMLLTLYLGYVIYNGDMIIAIGPYRGLYNSAWVGSLMTLTITLFVGWFGFYLVKNSVKRDIDTGVGQIIATTPTNRITYLLGKWFSNALILIVITLVLMFAALLMQITYREVPEINIWALMSPFIFIAIPTMIMVGGIAVFFEAVPFLRGGVGNVIYFFVFISMMPFVIESFEGWGINNDPWGIRLFMPSMQAAVCETFAYCKNTFQFTFPDQELLGKALYPGIQWTWDLIYPRFLWIGIGLTFVLLGALFFNRFDATKKAKAGKRKARKQAKAAEAAVAPIRDYKPLSSLQKRTTPFSFGRVCFHELLLLLKSYPLWLYVPILGLVIASLFSPVDVTRNFLLPASWALPILIWSKMGCRETEFNTQQLIFTTPALIRKQWLASYLAGAAVTAISGSGALVSFLIHQPAGAAAAWFTAVLFIPALALALGSISGTPRAFEVIYALIWYIGPLQQAAELDFIGAVSAPSYTAYFLAAAGGLLILALLARYLRLRSL